MARELNLYARTLRQCTECHIPFSPRGWDTANPAPGTVCPDCTAKPILMAMQYYWGCTVGADIPAAKR